MTHSPKSLNAMLSRFAPVQIVADISHLSAGDRAALRKLLEAAPLIDEIFYRQVWDGNVQMREQLAAASGDNAAALHRNFVMNKGPWSRVDEHKPFVEGAPAKPKGANFYPMDMTAEEFNAWVATLPEDQRADAAGYYQLVCRENGLLKMVPYHVAYAEQLAPAADLLVQAAKLTDNESLRTFLMHRASAFLSNFYRHSEMAWMDVDAPLEIVMGPSETYEDELFGYKAAFQAFITVVNPVESAKLQSYIAWRQELENHLPMWYGYRNKKVGSDSPIKVVDLISAHGDAAAGGQTMAFNLPNDEQVTAEKGTKNVLLRNVIQAKFDKVLMPIARRVMSPGALKSVAFDPFFTHVVVHELLHGLGPHGIKLPGGRKSTVREELKDLHSGFEETKADVCSLWSIGYLIDKGFFPKELRQSVYVTAVADMFRGLRGHGLGEAHGMAQAIQFNFFSDEGAIKLTKHGYAIDVDKMEEAVKRLARLLLTIQAQGDYDAALALKKRYVKIRPRMRRELAKLGSDIPLDIAPTYATANELLGS